MKVGFVLVLPLLCALAACAQGSPAGQYVDPFVVSNQSPEEPTSACDAAVLSATEASRLHYQTHPMYSDEFERLSLAGTPEADARMQAIMNDEEAVYEAIQRPVFDACEGREDLFNGAFKHDTDKTWGARGASGEWNFEAKESFLFRNCIGDLAATRACSNE